MSNTEVARRVFPGSWGPYITDNTQALEEELKLLKETTSFIDGMLTNIVLKKIGEEVSGFLRLDDSDSYGGYVWRWSLDFRVGSESMVRILIPRQFDFKEKRISIFLEHMGNIRVADRIVGRFVAAFRAYRQELHQLSPTAV
jgi:hypothetical protein